MEHTSLGQDNKNITGWALDFSSQPLCQWLPKQDPMAPLLVPVVQIRMPPWTMAPSSIADKLLKAVGNLLEKEHTYSFHLEVLAAQVVFVT